MRGAIGPGTLVLQIIGQRVRLLGLDKPKRGIEPMRTVLNVAAYQEYLRNEGCNPES